MTSQQTKTIIGALVAIGLVFAVSYGLISQQTADKIQTQANQSLSNGPSAPVANAAPQQPAQTNPNPQGSPQAGGAAPQRATPARQP